MRVRVLVNLRREGRIRVVGKVRGKDVGWFKVRVLVCLRGQIRMRIARKVMVGGWLRVRIRITEKVRVLVVVCCELG